MKLLQGLMYRLSGKGDTARKTQSWRGHCLVSASVRGKARLRPDEIRSLKVGSLIKIYQVEEGEELELIADGCVVGSCELATVRGERAIRVTSIVPPDDRLSSEK